MDIAAAAVSMAHAAAAGEGDDKEIPAVAIAPRRGQEGAQERPAGQDGGKGRTTGTAGWEGGPKGKHHDKRPRLVKHEKERRPGRVEDDGPMARLFLGAGRKAGIRPGRSCRRDHGRSRRDVAVCRRDSRLPTTFSLVEVPESLADHIIAALKATTIRGKKIRSARSRPGIEASG